MNEKNRKIKEDRKCLNCDFVFSVLPSSKQKYCSVSCGLYKRFSTKESRIKHGKKIAQNYIDFPEKRDKCSRRQKGILKNKREERSCKMCNKILVVPVNSKRKYCSYDCSHKGRGQDEKGILKVEKIEKICEYCGKIFKCDRTSNKRFCNQKCYGRDHSIKCSGIKNPMYGKHHTKIAKYKSSQKHKLLWKNENFVEKMHESFDRKPTKPELFLDTLMQKMELFDWEYTGDFSFWVGGKNPDFVNFKTKQIIEVFGDYWHANPDVYKKDDLLYDDITAQQIWERDKERIKLFEDKGYTVLVLWEYEINNYQSLVKNKIENLCNIR